MRRTALKAWSNGVKGKFKRKKKNGKVKKSFSEVSESLFDVADDKNVPENARAFLEA